MQNHRYSQWRVKKWDDQVQGLNGDGLGDEGQLPLSLVYPNDNPLGLIMLVYEGAITWLVASRNIGPLYYEVHVFCKQNLTDRQRARSAASTRGFLGSAKSTKRPMRGTKSTKRPFRKTGTTTMNKAKQPKATSGRVSASRKINQFLNSFAIATIVFRYFI